MKINIYNSDNLEIMAKMPDESIDVICIDPPYLYLKNQKLERPFDEQKFFTECKRVLTKDGFIVMFGRGSSFYRWNTILEDLKFNFKEEIIWNKSHCTSPLMNLSRVHETIAIFCKGKSGINKVKIPYLEMKGHDIDSIIADVKRLKTTFNNAKSLQAVIDFLEKNIRLDREGQDANFLSVSSKIKSENRCVTVMNSVSNGLNEKTIIRTDFEKKSNFSKFSATANNQSVGSVDRCVTVMNSINNGHNEKSIIKQVRNHYNAIHPTEKPVRLLERLLKLVIPMKKENIVIADWFAGSFSCCEAVINLQSEFPDKEFSFIGTEIDEEYFNNGKQRIENIKPNLFSKVS